MRYIILLILTCICFSTPALAQEPGHTLPTASDTHTATALADSTSCTSLHVAPEAIMPQPMTTANADTLFLPATDMRGVAMPFVMRPLGYGGWGLYDTWGLHPGLNLSLGASVFAQFGKNARGGAGFTQDISAMYAMPLGKKASLAVGGYLDNVMWGHDTWRDAGLSAVMGYKFNERWEAYLYAQKSLTTRNAHIPLPIYDIGNIGDRIGAAVKYNFSPNVSVQLSVEHGWMPSPRHQYFDQYNYPVPRQ